MSEDIKKDDISAEALFKELTINMFEQNDKMMNMIAGVISTLMKPDEFKHIGNDKYVAILDSETRDNLVNKLSSVMEGYMEWKSKLMFKIQLLRWREQK